MLDFNKTIEEAQRSQIAFLRIELATSMTFARRAQTTNDPATRERNRQHARTGYEAVVDSLSRARLEAPEVDEIADGIRRLKLELAKLGESFEVEGRPGL